MIDNPCYDKIAKTDCPDRHQGCSVTCSKWAIYLSERNKDYERRKRIAEANNAIIDSGNAREALRQRQLMKDRRYRRSRRSD